MNRVLAQSQLTEKLALSALLWMGFAILLPTRIANFDFKHIVASEAITISFSKSSPPLAALEDEKLPDIFKTAPAPIKTFANHAIPKHRMIAKHRVLKHKHSHTRVARVIRHKSNFMAHIAELEKLVKAIPAVPIPNARKSPAPIRSVAVAAAFENKNRIRVRSVHSSMNQPTRNTGNLRQRVEAPLTAPTVERGLPRGEDARPVVIEEDRISKAEINPNSVRANTNAAAAPTSDVPVEKPTTVAMNLAAAPLPAAPAQGRWQFGGPRPSSPSGGRGVETVPVSKAQPPPVHAPVSRNQIRQQFADARLPASVGIQSLDGGSSGAGSTAKATSTTPATQDDYQIDGEVELTGGLAITGSANQMTIQFRTGNQVRDARIDYSSGHFDIQVPTLAGGKIIGLVKDQSGKIIGRGEYDLDDAGADTSHRYLGGISLTIEAQQSLVKGSVTSAYSVDKIIVPVKEAEIFGPAQTRDAADKNGNYRLSGINSDSTMFVDAYAPEHWGTRVLATGTSRPRIPLFPDKMVQSFLDILDQGRGNSEYGIVWGVITHKGKPVGNATVGISTADAIGPIYFNELRIPDKNLKGTSSNGLFAFVKVAPGLHIVMSQFQNHELPSSVVSVSASEVSYAQIKFKALEIKGRVVDAVARLGVPAKVSVVGASATGSATSAGFQMRVPSSDPVVFIEANAGSGYMVSRAALPRQEAADTEIPVYRKDWIVSQMRKVDLKYDDHKGWMVGLVNGPSFHVSIGDTADARSPEDTQPVVTYFDADGNPNAELLEGTANGGAFMVSNIKPGLHTLVISSSDGDVVMSRLFVAEGGVVNVLSVPLRP